MPTANMNLPKLVDQFHTEDKCHEYLAELRWPDGVRCPRCESEKISRIHKRRQFQCESCRYQFSVRVGTILQDSHLPLWKWFLATYLLIESKKGMSSKQLQRTLKVGYKTAWYLTHRIRAAMKDDNPDLLDGTVEVDETYVGGKKRGGKVRQGSKAHKTMVLGAVQRGGKVRFHIDERANRQILHSFVRRVVADDAIAIYTDDNPAYDGIGDEDTKHETVKHSLDEWVRADVHTNSVESVWSLLKRSIVGSYHQLSAKHLPAYLDEMTWRFNNRDNPYLFRDTLLRLLNEHPLRYQQLVNPS